MRIVVWDDETDEEKRDHIENGDSPKDLLRRSRYCFSRIFALRSGQTNEFSATKSKTRSNENGTDSLESISESAGIMPSRCSQITPFWGAATVDDNAENDEADDSDDLDGGKD